jgi:large subunit ribosomal protein L4
MKLPVISLDQASPGEIELDETVFGLKPRSDLLARVVNWQRAKRQQGTHKTKGKSEISGTGKKPFAQKGGGRARQGSLRSAQFRGGQTTFGPLVRSHAFSLPKKVRRLALKHALSSKQRAGQIVVLDAATMAEPKTKLLAEKIKSFGWRSALIVDGAEPNRNFHLALRNIPHIDVLAQRGANVFDILRRETLVLTREAVAHLQERLR